MLAIERLTKVFSGSAGKEVRAVHEASLQVRKGELLVLLGPSGSGKTTLLRMIAGLEEPSAGGIVLDGRTVTAVPPQDRGIAMVFQEHALYPHMTAGENLAFGLKLRKVERSEIESRVRETADLLGLTTLLDRPPQSLSGGERQRVALGRAIVLRSNVLLLDEPFSNLDAPLRADLRRELVKLQRRLGITMVYVTHDQIEAMTLAHRVAVMHQGAILQVAEPLEVYNRPADLFVASFLGVPPINCFPGALFENGEAIWFRAQEMDWSFRLQASPGSEVARAADRQVILAVRPEHIRELRATEPCAPFETALTGQVDLVEPLGWETHVWLTSRVGGLVVRIPTQYQAKIGDSLDVALDLRHAYLFDAASGRKLSSDVTRKP